MLNFAYDNTSDDDDSDGADDDMVTGIAQLSLSAVLIRFCHLMLKIPAQGILTQGFPLPLSNFSLSFYMLLATADKIWKFHLLFLNILCLYLRLSLVSLLFVHLGANYRICYTCFVL